MEEVQEVKRSRKWIWIPIGLIATLAVAFTFFALTFKPRHPYQFLNQAQLVEYQQQISKVPGSVPVYAESSTYRLTSAYDSLEERMSKELAAAGLKKVGYLGDVVMWESLGQTIFLSHDKQLRGSLVKGESLGRSISVSIGSDPPEIRIWITTYEKANFFHEAKVWFGNLTQRNEVQK